MPVFEMEFGVFVRAESQEEAESQVGEIRGLLDGLDTEGSSSFEVVGEVPDEN